MKIFRQTNTGTIIYEFLSDESTVSTMEVFKSIETNEPYIIEWYISELDEIETIGLWFDKDKKLVDYDGVFELPKQAITLIRYMGYIVPKDFEV